MARVIKQGNCRFSVATNLKSGAEDRASKGETFNSLAKLFPDDKGQESLKKDALHGKEGPERDGNILEEAKAKAERIVTEAKRQAEEIKKEAEKIVSAAKKNAEEIESQAYNLGYDQGHRDGEELGRRQFEVGLQHLEKFLESFKEQTAGLSSSYEAQMLQVCLFVAKAIIEKEISDDDELIARVLKKALDKTVEGSTITVHLNPRDFENLREDFLSRLSTPGGNRLELRPDAKVSRGGCMIETDFGLVDASLESRWQSLLEDIKTQLFERTGVELSGELRKINQLEGDKE